MPFQHIVIGVLSVQC